MKWFIYFYTLWILTPIAHAHHDGTGADVSTTTADSPNFILIGVGILVAVALAWIIFSKPKKQ